MPPKKLSKKELERKKKEEEERKRQEEEEERIRAEQEEKERIQREKLEAEERKKNEKIELKKRSIELEEFREVIGEVENKLINNREKFRQQFIWDRYLRCDGSPDPSILQEINTYMNLWREVDNDVSIVPVMKEANLCLALIEELEFLIEEYQNDESLEAQITQYDETMKKLQNLLQEKIDRTSLEMLSHASMIKEKDDNNLTKHWEFRNIVLCLWANLSKKIKFGEFKFPEIGLSISVPKSLILSDLGFRILFTKYDHCSLLCKHFYARMKEKPIEEAVVEPVPEISPEEGEGKEGEGNEDEKEDEDIEKEEEPLNLMDELNQAGLNEDEKEETVQEQEEEVDPPPEDKVSTPEPPEWEDFDGEDNVLDLRSVNPIGGIYHINLVHLPPQPKIARSWLMTHQVVPPLLTAYPYDLTMAGSQLGGSQVSLGAHPATPSNEPIAAASSSPAPNNAEDQAPKPSTTAPPINNRNSSADADRESSAKDKHALNPVPITLKLPDDVIIAEEPQLALWYEEEQVWKTGDIFITDFKEQEKTLQFHMLKFGILGIFQDFHANMPFQSWTLRPFREVFPDESIEEPSLSKKKSSAVDSETSQIVVEKTKIDYDIDSKYQCVLIITAAIFEVKLHICNDKIRIFHDKERKELNGLAGKWYDLSTLVKVMRSAGINIFPREDSHKYVTVTEKNRVAEKRLYDQMAFLSPSVAFGGSRWNSECKNSSTIVLLASEHLNAERTVNEDDWKVLSFTRKKVEQLKMSEYDESFSMEKDERVDFHSNLYHYYENIGSEEGLIPVKNLDIHFYDTVRKLLNAVRPVVFS